MGRRSRALDAVLGAREATLLAAANPGRRLHAAENVRREARLRAWLRRFAPDEGWSGAGPWRETQFLVRSPPVRLRRVARCFGQRALVGLRRGQPPRLVLLERRQPGS